jgi:pimeloyl-ACP methyl ester carboxylesterase
VLNKTKNFFVVIISILLFLFFPIFAKADILASDLNDNGITDSLEEEVIIDHDSSLPHGEYVFNNLFITNGATLYLVSDSRSTDSFKGVQITANNISVSATSKISGDGHGYDSISGPGSSGLELYYAGGSYGGLGYNNLASSIYGSEREPKDLGSGGAICCTSSTAGGGAVRIIASGNFQNDGIVSVNGFSPGSGGSLYVTINNLSGSGIFEANGGSLYFTGFFAGPGGGGRVAVYYKDSTFTGTSEAKGGCGSIDGFSLFCAGSGSVVLEDLTPPCTVDCNSSVLFLPGIESSRLYESNSVVCDINCEDELWEPNANSDVRALFLDSSGQSINTDIYTRDVISEAYGTINIYKSFLEMLDGLKSDGKIADYSAVPYDWRLSLNDILSGGKKDRDNISYLDSTSSPYIISELERLADSSKNGKVTIIAHSNGGLVAKALLKKLSDEHNPLLDKIDMLIMVAVPQLGTPAAIVADLHGYNQDLPSSLAPIFMSSQTAREFAQNSPMAYNLLPSEQYFSLVSTTVANFDESLPEWQNKFGENVNSKDSLHSFLIDNTDRTFYESNDTKTPAYLNETLLTKAENIHNELDNWQIPESIKVIEIAGWGVPTTISGVTYEKVGRRIKPNYQFTIDGDGTVVAPSALALNNIEQYWVDLDSYNIFLIRHADHKSILEISELLDLIAGKITNLQSFSPFKYISTTSPVSRQEKLRLIYSLHSPLTFDIYDPQGHHTGISTTTGKIEEQIPGTYFLQFGEEKYVFTNEGEDTQVVMSGYDTGTFTFNINEMQDDNIISTISFANVPTTPSTKVSMSIFGNISSTSPLLVDLNGDNVQTIILQPVINNIVEYKTQESSKVGPQDGGNGPILTSSVPNSNISSEKISTPTTSINNFQIVKQSIISSSTLKSTTTNQKILPTKAKLALAKSQVAQVITVAPNTNVIQNKSLIKRVIDWFMARFNSN